MEKLNKEGVISIYQRMILLVLGMLAICLGTTLMMKANLGQTSVAAFAKNVEFLSGIKSGTILAFVNYLAFIIQIILLKKEFKIVQVLQLVITSIFGIGVNFFSYDFALTTNFSPNLYILKWICLVGGISLSTLGVAAMIKADLIFMPFEGFCNAVVYKSEKPFSKVRPIIDFVIVSFSVILIIIFGIPNTTIREGTVFCTIFFGKFVGFYTKHIFK